MIGQKISDELEALVEVVSQFAAREIRPAAEEAEKNFGVEPALTAKLLGLGVTASIPDSVGGDGVLEPIEYLTASEHLAVGDPGIAYATLGAGQAALLVALAGSEEQQQTLLAPFADRFCRGSVLLYEGFGRAPSEFTTTARRQGDGWVINGLKNSVLNADAPDLAVIVATDADTGELRLFATAGLPDGATAVDEDHGHKLGLRAAPTAVVKLADVTLPADAELRSDQDTIHRAVSLVRLSVAAIALGAGQAGIDYSAAYAKERKTFGKPIASYQGVAFLLADAVISITASRHSVQGAAARLDEKIEPLEIERFVTDVVGRVCMRAVDQTRTAVQVLGGHGYIVDHPVERWYRAAMGLAVLDLDPLVTPFRTP